MGMSERCRSLRDQSDNGPLMVPAVAAVVHDEDGLVLMMRHRADGKWSLPAGAIEPGEAPDGAVAREVYEETGLEVAPTKLLGVLGGRDYRVTYPGGDEVEYTIVVYGCERLGGELCAVDGESLELGWFEPYDPPETGVEYPPEMLAGDVDSGGS